MVHQNIVSIKGICIKDRKVLLKKDPQGPGWSFPGGKIEYGEDPLQTLRRELREELGQDCRVLDARPLWAASFALQGDDGPEQITRIYYLVDFDNYNFPATDEQAGTKFFDAGSLADAKAIPIVDPAIELVITLLA